MDKKWRQVLDILKSQISPANFKTWFSQSSFGSLSDDSLVITVASTFVKNQLNVRYLPIIESAVESTFGKKLKIEFKIDSSKITKKDTQFEFENEESPILSSLPVSINHSIGLNPKYTLTNFVVGMSNNLAFAAAQAVALNPGTSYNPLFIYGGTGVGKTHLMQGVGNALITKNPDLKIIYCSSETFMNDFVQSIQTKRTAEFKTKYRSANLLLIDDIQFIAGRDSTQEEFFHTYNELHAKNTQIILTSDRPPNDISDLEARLKSRFQGGLMVDIQLPDFDTRVAILKAKCQERGELIDETILTLIAESIATNARELEGKFTQIVQTAKLTNQELTEDLTRRLLGKPTQTSQIIDYKKVLLGINDYFHIKMSDLTGPRRKRELVVPRQLAMYILYEDCKLPFQKIGQVLGNRDHTTILHGVDKIRQSVTRDRELQRLLIEIKQSLN